EDTEIAERNAKESIGSRSVNLNQTCFSLCSLCSLCPLCPLWLYFSSRLPQLRHAINQGVEERAGDAAAVGGSQRDVLFVGAVEVAAAGLEQTVAVGEL